MSDVISLIMSTFALIIAGFALGWNIYKDVIMKARVKVRYGRKTFIEESLEPYDKILLTGTNYGPGDIKLNMIVYKSTGIFKRLLRKEQKGIILQRQKHIDISDTLPKLLAEGEEVNIFFPLDAGFINTKFTHIGLRDCYDKIHWAPKRDVKRFFNHSRSDEKNN